MEDKNITQKGAQDQELKPLTIAGDTYLTRYTKKYGKRHTWSKPKEQEVISFIPGTVREVLVKKGDKVEAGQKMMVLEAMKMMNSVNAPVAGIVKSVHVAVGDCLPKGTLMIELE